jgi:hypothetical protein
LRRGREHSVSEGGARHSRAAANKRTAAVAKADVKRLKYVRLLPIRDYRGKEPANQRLDNKHRGSGIRMHTYYRLLPPTDVRKDEESIIEILSAVKDDMYENDIKLLNYYREVPINFGASIDHIERGMVEMTIHPLQAVLMKLQKETLIRSCHFKHDVVAKVSKAGTEKRFAFLTGFSYVQILSDRRSNIRVEVFENVDVAVRAGQLQLQGRLKDISIGGLAIIAPEIQGVAENARVKLTLSLRGHGVELTGTVLRVLDEAPRKIYVIQYNPDSKSDATISQYIFQTQSEIIRELKEKIL